MGLSFSRRNFCFQVGLVCSYAGDVGVVGTLRKEDFYEFNISDGVWRERKEADVEICGFFKWVFSLNRIWRRILLISVSCWSNGSCGNLTRLSTGRVSLASD